MGAMLSLSQLCSANPSSSHFSPAPVWGLPQAAVLQEMPSCSATVSPRATGELLLWHPEHFLPSFCRAGSLTLAPCSSPPEAPFSSFLKPVSPRHLGCGAWPCPAVRPLEPSGNDCVGMGQPQPHPMHQPRSPLPAPGHHDQGIDQAQQPHLCSFHQRTGDGDILAFTGL